MAKKPEDQEGSKRTHKQQSRGIKYESDFVCCTCQREVPSIKEAFPPKKTKVFIKRNIEEPTNEEPTNDEDMLTDNFDSDGKSSLNINCNVVSVIPHEYD